MLRSNRISALKKGSTHVIDEVGCVRMFSRNHIVERPSKLPISRRLTFTFPLNSAKCRSHTGMTCETKSVVNMYSEAPIDRLMSKFSMATVIEYIALVKPIPFLI